MSRAPTAPDGAGGEQPVRAAVIGAGVMGRWHARELERAGGVVVGVADRDRAAATRLASVHRAAPGYDDLDRMLVELAPEVLHICTPPSTHAALATRAIKAGIHVLLEKPLAPTAGETAELLRRAEQAGVLLCPVHQYLFQRPMLGVRRFLAQIEPIVSVLTVACSAGGVGRAPRELDEIAAEILPHPLAVIHRILESPVDELEWSASAPSAGELRAVALEHAPTVSVSVSLAGRPTVNDLTVVGERGTLRIDFFHGFAVLESGAVSRRRKVARPFALGASLALGASANLAWRALERESGYPGLRALIAAMYTSVRRAAAPPISGAESLAVARAQATLIELASERAPLILRRGRT